MNDTTRSAETAQVKYETQVISPPGRRAREMVLGYLFLITSTVASAAVWAYLYSPDNGLINGILKGIGLPTLKWLGEPTGIFQMFMGNFGVKLPDFAAGPSLALVSVLIFSTWVFLGYDVAIFLAGLGNLSAALASERGRFFTL